MGAAIPLSTNLAAARAVPSPAPARAAPSPTSPPAPAFDRQVAATLIAAHQKAVYGYLRARLVEPADAEDLCQEVFLRCCQAAESAPPGERSRGWLLGVARNVLREHVRKARRRKQVAWTDLCLELDALAAEHDEADAAAEHLPACLEALGPTARQTIDLRYQRNLKLADIGGALRRTETAVKLLLHRARLALKACLERKIGAASHA